MVIKWRKRREGKWVPEDRLRSALPGALVMVPCSILFMGLVVQYIEGTTGLVLCMILMFMNGLGVSYTRSSFSVSTHCSPG